MAIFLLINGPKVVKYTYFICKFSRDIDITYKVANSIVFGKVCTYWQQTKTFDLNNINA